MDRDEILVLLALAGIAAAFWWAAVQPRATGAILSSAVPPAQPIYGGMKPWQPVPAGTDCSKVNCAPRMTFMQESPEVLAVRRFCCESFA